MSIDSLLGDDRSYPLYCSSGWCCYGRNENGERDDLARWIMTLLIDDMGVPVFGENLVSKINELLIFGEDFVTPTNRCVSTEQ